ncbi:Something about silencing protein 10 [Schistosoma japonicum]|nr:Something about silencing protein 10 [Schistosoma japonicum]
MKQNENVGKQRAKPSYYGGDKFDADDEESQKLCINDCRQKQTALYPPFLFKSLSAQLLLTPPDLSELFVMTGQSRINLYLQQSQNKVSDTHKYHGDSTHSNILNSTEVDLVVCKLSNLHVPPFPRNLSSEVSIFRSHGLPLLVWPQSTDKTFIQKYLDDNYPDCGRWFNELNKVMGWLEQKWRPLTQNLGIIAKDTMNSRDDDIKLDKSTCIRGLPSNCVAVIYLKKRSTQYEKYASLLKAYFTHRLQYSPAFHHSPIHRELGEHYKERISCIAEDAGYFNIIGNRLIQVINKALTSGRPYSINPVTFSSCITDPNMREQCLLALLPENEVKIIQNKRKNTTNKLQRMDSDSQLIDSQSDNDVNLSEYDDDDDPKLSASNKNDIVDSNATNQSSCGLPNRPISKEIMKNKGIVKYRHKRERNPRVHLRHKYRKATIRYRSRCAPVRKEDKPYAGEFKGIRVNLIKSHKFKKLYL